VSALDTADIRGNLGAVDPLVAAAIERSPVCLFGPVGCGKTMIAARLAGLLPLPSESQRLDIVAGIGAFRLWRYGEEHALCDVARPFRAPHYTVSAAGLAAEVALARHGILFLDDIEEFRSECLLSVMPALMSGTAWVVVATSDPERSVKRLDWLGIRRNVTLTRVTRDVLNDGPRWPATAQLRARVSLLAAGGGQ
jgi:magnesium chelatase family protein